MITLEGIKESILEEESEVIYYSAQTLWWTHSEIDLTEATYTGREYTAKKIRKRISSIKSRTEKRELKEALRMLLEESTMAVDPEGNKVFETSNVKAWMEKAEERKEHFGKNGIEAFIRTHHRNCNGWCPTKWEQVNSFIDIQNMLKNSNK